MSITTTRLQYRRLNNVDLVDTDEDDEQTRSAANDASGAMIELRSRGRSSDRLLNTSSAAVYRDETEPQLVFTERPLLKTDTLQGLALLYRIPVGRLEVADLKRYNNLLKDQDFYALKSLKIPLNKHSMLGVDAYNSAAPSTSTAFVDDLIPLNTDNNLQKHQSTDSVNDDSVTSDDAPTRSVEKLLRATDRNIDYVANRHTQYTNEQDDVFNGSVHPSDQVHFYAATCPTADQSVWNSRAAGYCAIGSVALALLIIGYLLLAEGRLLEALKKSQQHRP